jgi:hypothetical protein
MKFYSDSQTVNSHCAAKIEVCFESCKLHAAADFSDARGPVQEHKLVRRVGGEAAHPLDPRVSMGRVRPGRVRRRDLVRRELSARGSGAAGKVLRGALKDAECFPSGAAGKVLRGALKDAECFPSGAAFLNSHYLTKYHLIVPHTETDDTS